MSIQPHDLVLVCPESPDLKEALRAKEDEYNDRIEAYMVTHSDRDSDRQRLDLAVEICGLAILRELLQKGRIYGFDTAAEFFNPLMNRREPDYWQAFFVPWQQAWSTIKKICENS
jgi:hypothetical protein